MPTNQEYEYLDLSGEDTLLKILEKNQNHPSIKLIKAWKNQNLPTLA